jgi:hypothetical protein
MLACRNQEKGEAACADITQRDPPAKVKFHPLDLGTPRT